MQIELLFVQHYIVWLTQTHQVSLIQQLIRGLEFFFEGVALSDH